MSTIFLSFTYDKSNFTYFPITRGFFFQGEVGDSMEITANAAASSSSVLNAAVSRSKNDTVEGI